MSELHTAPVRLCSSHLGVIRSECLECRIAALEAENERLAEEVRTLNEGRPIPGAIRRRDERIAELERHLKWRQNEVRGQKETIAKLEEQLADPTRLTNMDRAFDRMKIASDRIAALEAEVNEAKSLLREWIRDPRRLREAYIMSETARRTSRFLRIKKDANHD